MIEHFNYILKSADIPSSWNESVTILIPKKSEDKFLIQNWRPISLTNTDYKIFTKILANRLNSGIIQKVVGNHQNGFIKNRSILDNLLDIDSILNYYNKENRKGSLLFLDQQKAFDRVDHNFLINTIQSFGFSYQFSNLIQNLYKNQISFLNLNGFTSDKFKLCCGV